MAYDPFENLHKFQDDVWGQIRLNDLERDVIDSPEFQRLFRTSQLGFVELVLRLLTKLHTRYSFTLQKPVMKVIYWKRIELLSRKHARFLCA